LKQLEIFLVALTDKVENFLLIFVFNLLNLSIKLTLKLDFFILKGGKLVLQALKLAFSNIFLLLKLLLLGRLALIL